MQFNEKLFPLERQLSNFSPREGVDFREILKHHHAHVSYC